MLILAFLHTSMTGCEGTNSAEFRPKIAGESIKTDHWMDSLSDTAGSIGAQWQGAFGSNSGRSDW